MYRNNARNTRSWFETDYYIGKRVDLRIGLLALCLLIKPMTVFAGSATPGSTLLEELVVTGKADVLSERIESLPGGADLVYTDDIKSSANLTMSRALAETPGVVIQNFFGGNDQPRIQIRGSGLQQNPVERGTLILQNGLPINRADGSYAVFNDHYAVLDLRSDYRINNVSLFMEVTNVTDKTYASSTLITDQARSDQAAFLPGDGRGFFLGVQLVF